MLLGNSVVYLFGLLWLTRFVDDVFITGLNPFILGDTLKLLLATLLLPSGWKLLALSKGKSESI
jgi:biotin transport system substrate-specific component